jgi:hypothetical protein
MRSRFLIVVAASIILLSLARARAGSCDFVIHWDEQAIGSCVRELKSEIATLRLQLQTEETENRVARGSICLLALDSKTAGAADIAETACAELKVAAEKKRAAPAGAKSKKP